MSAQVILRSGRAGRGRRLARPVWWVVVAVAVVAVVQASAAAARPVAASEPAVSRPPAAVTDARTGGGAPAPGPPTDVRLGVRVIPPFVESGPRLRGFSVELWAEIARVANLRTVSTTTAPDVNSLLDAVQQRQVDAAIAAISITSEREGRVDFSQPMFDAGLGVLTKEPEGSDGAEGGTSLISRVFSAVASRNFAELALWILVLTLVPAHIIYFIERRRGAGMLARTSYLHGIAETYFWSITALASQADNSPKTRLGRGVAVLWMYFSVIFIAFFTAGVTSNLTSERLLGAIQGPQDLPGARVVTVAKSTAAKYLDDQQIPATEVADVEDAYRQLDQGRVDAMVFDAPVLRYYESHGGKGRVRTVGGTFRPEGYGIALPQGSPLRQRIDVALLQLREDGTYARLVRTWFGDESS
jgi:polar amino acid transport system substrate-binding protein